jgi:hypothetical protein
VICEAPETCTCACRRLSLANGPEDLAHLDTDRTHAAPKLKPHRRGEEEQKNLAALSGGLLPPSPCCSGAPSLRTRHLAPPKIPPVSSAGPVGAVPATAPRKGSSSTASAASPPLRAGRRRAPLVPTPPLDPLTVSAVLPCFLVSP